jgi:hypothetical protein
MSTILVLIASALVALCALPDAHASAIISRPLYLGLDQGLVGYWSFEGKTVSGTQVYDASGTGNRGIMTNGPKAVNGRIGQAMQFDGGDDYVSIPDNSSLEPSSGITLSAWIKTSNSGSCGKIIGKADVASPFPGYLMRVNTAGASCIFANGNLAFWTGDLTNGWVSVALGSGMISDNQWHLITMTNNGLVSTIYFDGVSKTSASRGMSTGSNDDLEIGSDDFLDAASANFYNVPQKVDH